MFNSNPKQEIDNRIYFATSKAHSGCQFMVGSKSIHATATASASASGNSEHLAKKISEELAQIEAQKALKNYIIEYGISKTKIL